MLRLESHITTRNGRRVQWITHCATLGVKPLIIELNDGTQPVQMMCTAGRAATSYPAALDETESLETWFTRKGHCIDRVKIEATLGAGVRYDVIQAPAVVYYEAHIKLPLFDAEIPLLMDTSAAMGLAVSRTLLRPRSDGRTKWFLTDRCSSALSVDDAYVVFSETCALVSAAFCNVTMECEAVLYDSNSSVDDGWTNADIGRL